jgi:hypothetical protein
MPRTESATSQPKVRKIQGLSPLDALEVNRILRNISLDKVKDELDLWNKVKLFWPNTDGVTSFNTLPKLELNFDQKNIVKILATSICILNLVVSNEVFASSPHNQETITWAMEALEKLDPVEYLIYRKEIRKSVDAKYTFESDDKILLTWNLYREVRADVKEINDSNPYPIGILGVLNTVFERMKSKKYPSTVKGVIFEEFQFSWTLLLTKELKDEKIDIETYIKLRRIVENFSGKTFSENLQILQNYIEQKIGRALPENLTDYHLLGMLDNPKFNNEASSATKKRILFVENLYKQNPNHGDIILLGKHLFYNSAKMEKLMAQQASTTSQSK